MVTVVLRSACRWVWDCRLSCSALGPALPAQVCTYDLLAFARAAFSPSGPGPETQARFLNENLAHTVCSESSVPLGKTGEKPGDLDCSRKSSRRGEGQVWRQRSRDSVEHFSPVCPGPEMSQVISPLSGGEGGPGVRIWV